GTLIYITPTAGSMIESAARDDNSSGWQSVVHPDDYAATASAWLHALRTGSQFDVTHRFLRATGVHGWSRCRGEPLRDEHASIVGWYGALIDYDDLPSASLGEAERLAASETLSAIHA